MIINVLDKIAGVLVGMITGSLAAVWPTFFAYYLVAQSMRKSGYSWGATLLVTLTIGHFAALVTLFCSLWVAQFSLVYGMIAGGRNGLWAALTLPLRLPRQINRYLQYIVEDIFEEDISFSLSSVEDFFRTIIKLIVLSLFLLGKIVFEIFNIFEYNPEHAIDSDYTYAPPQQSQTLLSRIQALPTDTAHPLFDLTEKEIQDFEKAIQAQREGPIKKENERLHAYMTRQCPLSLASLAELNEIKDANQQVIPPITVEANFPGRPYVITYDYANFKTYLETEQNKPRLIAIVNGTADGDKLQDKHVRIYRGFYSVNVEAIRATIAKWKAQQERTHLQRAAEIERREAPAVNTETSWKNWVTSKASSVRASLFTVRPALPQPQPQAIKPSTLLLEQ
jgi:hypothetical protein